MFSDRFNVYKLKLYELSECKASSLGEYLTNILELSEDESIIYIIPVLNYEGYMIFGFENGKVAKIDMKSYETKVNRKKLINAYSNKSKIVGIMYIKEDEDLIALRDEDKAMLFNTKLIMPKVTKNSSGIQVYTLKKNSVMSMLVKKSEFKTEDSEYYRTDKIPATGHFINEDEKLKNIILQQS